MTEGKQIMSYKPLTAPIDSTLKLKQGERVKLTFSSNPSKLIRASQIAIIEWRLERNEDIEIIRADYWGEDTIRFEVEVMNTDALLTEQLIIALIMAANPSYFILTHKPAIKKAVITTIKTAQSIIPWIPSISICIGIIILLILWKK
ncbi:hypothetical protein ES705_22738 [subsurface metagenome]